ncbi:MAG: hypothetical protein K5683_06870 [Prevotella sp.]|nr:hypothetical protein [Prevotella sp.]
MKKILFGAIIMAITACGGASIPENFTQNDSLPAIYPDYTDVTIPVNIAPLSFQLEQQDADDAVVRYSCGDTEIVCGGLKAQPDIDDWHQLAEQAKGGDITVEVYAGNNGQWTRYQPFTIHVSPDSIDPYISYRLISPSYVTYEELTLNQRCLENYDEQVMVDNMLCATEKDGQCVNCHNYQMYNPQRMQFHARQNHGGTVIAYDGKIRKVNMKNDSVISAGVYPTWHPTLPLIVYSTNLTSQSFHTRHLNKIEVSDAASDLIIYDVENDKVATVENDPQEFECFPFWAPDGRMLYYCSAHFEYRDTINHAAEVFIRASDVKYNLYRKTFDPDSKTFGAPEMVFRADTLGAGILGLDTLRTDTLGLSATLPRISPDGRYLLFTLGRFGVFHIWHHEADLWMKDLETGEVRSMDEINSKDTESYHSWSSNGRWVIFSTRRNDGNFTRPFIAHIDKDGHGTKPFELPQKDPNYHHEFMKSYNIPEFMRGPVTITPQQFADVLKNDDVKPAQFVPHL